MLWGAAEVGADDDGAGLAGEAGVGVVVHEPVGFADAEPAAVEVEDYGEVFRGGGFLRQVNPDPEIVVAVVDGNVLDGDTVDEMVVGRDRIGHELELWWSGPRPVDETVVVDGEPAGNLIDDLSLGNHCFCFGVKLEVWVGFVLVGVWGVL